MNIIEPKLTFRGAFTLGNKPTHIIVHHALASQCTVQDVHSWHIGNGWIGIGYHYFVDKDGKVYRGRPENAQGAHCKEQSMNEKSIGICLEGCYERYEPKAGVVIEDKVVPVVQLAALKELVEDIQKRLDIPDANVEPHRKYATYKKCPGDHFPWEYFKASLAAGTEPTVRDAVNFLAQHKCLTAVEQWVKKATDDKYLGMVFTNVYKTFK